MDEIPPQKCHTINLASVTNNCDTFWGKTVYNNIDTPYIRITLLLTEYGVLANNIILTL